MNQTLKTAYRGLRRKIGNTLRNSPLNFQAAELLQMKHELLLSEKTSVASKIGQMRLVQEWKRMLHHGEPLPSLAEVEFRAFSQNGEDGILLYLFSLIGAQQRSCVEICAGDGIECNSANLILNHGWTALLVDGSLENVQTGKQFYAQHRDTFSFPPQFAHAWVDRETINDLIERHGFKGEVDLLSIDLDGVDYWIWEAIHVIRPRVVVAETQCIWGSERSVTVPYRRDFSSPLVQGFGVYSGASLPAFVRLGRRKGYRLVGTQSLGFNAFFVRDDLGAAVLPEVSAESCLDRPFVRWAQRELLPLVRDKEWVEV
jgi:hypothetical protein